MSLHPPREDTPVTSPLSLMRVLTRQLKESHAQLDTVIAALRALLWAITMLLGFQLAGLVCWGVYTLMH